MCGSSTAPLFICIFQCSKNDRSSILSFIVCCHWSNGTLHSISLNFIHIHNFCAFVHLRKLHVYFDITWILFVQLSPLQFNEKKPIAFIEKRFCHTYIDFIAKIEQILRLFRFIFLFFYSFALVLVAQFFFNQWCNDSRPNKRRKGEYTSVSTVLKRWRRKK